MVVELLRVLTYIVYVQNYSFHCPRHTVRTYSEYKNEAQPTAAFQSPLSSIIIIVKEQNPHDDDDTIKQEQSLETNSIQSIHHSLL